MFLAIARRGLSVADRLARCFSNRRNSLTYLHTRSDKIPVHPRHRARYEQVDDLDFMRTDPAFKHARGRSPETCEDLCLATDAVASRERPVVEGR